MRLLQELLGRFFAPLDRLQESWSLRWREHANRRTTIILVALGAAATLAYIYVIEPPSNFPVDRLVNVPQGSLSEVAEGLKDNGVIRSPLAFKVLVVLFGNERSARAGDYIFKEPRDVFRVARAIALGAFGLEPTRIRIPEGATSREMAIVFRSRLERFNEL